MCKCDGNLLGVHFILLIYIQVSFAPDLHLKIKNEKNNAHTKMKSVHL